MQSVYSTALAYWATSMEDQTDTAIHELKEDTKNAERKTDFSRQ